MSMYECPKCGGLPGVTACCSDQAKGLVIGAQPAPITSESGNQAAQGASAITRESAQAGALLTYEEIEAVLQQPIGDRKGNRDHIFAEAIEQAVRSKLGAGVPMTDEQTDAMFEEVQRRANQLADEGRYTFGGWFPIAVELIEAHHGIVGKEGA